MDAQQCTEILWAITKDFTTEEGNAQNLAKLRISLARGIFATDGKGFPPGMAPHPGGIGSVAWKGCVGAATDAASESAKVGGNIVPTYLLLWSANKKDPGIPELESPRLDLKWPATDRPTEVFGPVLDGAKRKISLFAYSNIDTKQALSENGIGDPGLYPPDLRFGIQSATPAAATISGHLVSHRTLALFLFLIAVVSALFSTIWVYGAAEPVRTSVQKILQSIQITLPSEENSNKWTIAPTAQSTSDPLMESCLEEVTKRLNNESVVSTEPVSCTKFVHKAWQDEVKKLDKSSGYWYQALAFFADLSGVREPGVTSGNQTTKRLSLFGPFVLSLLAILLLIISAGYAIRGRFYGAFIDGRNRFSLSRLQQLLWTTILLAGLMVFGVFNISLLADFVRNVAQANELAAAISLSLGFFPSMDPALWAVLGITIVVSPYLSQSILKDKEGDAKAYNSLENKPMVKPESIDRRPEPSKARWTDLFTGEAAVNSNIVDVSRLQHLVITLLLLSGYLVLLVEYTRSIDAMALLITLLTGAPVFAALPPVDGTFIGLLGLSHAGYLAFKAMPASNAAAGTAAQGNP